MYVTKECRTAESFMYLNLIVPDLVKKLPTFIRTGGGGVHYIVHMTSLIFVQSQMTPVHVLKQHFFNFHLSIIQPITVAARSKAWTVFSHSNTGIVGSNSTWAMNVCVPLFCVCVVLCVGIGLATGSSPVQGVLPTVYRLRNWKSGHGPKGCTAIDRERRLSSYISWYFINGPFPSGFSTKFSYFEFHVFPISATCPAHVINPDFISLVIFDQEHLIWLI
jgi:hypothetical protein